jgi:predicted nucleic acid-binding protein
LSRYTIDASIAIKWFIPEEGSDSALRLLAEDLLCPDLLFPEVGNILWKKMRRGEIHEDKGQAVLNVLSRGQMEVHASSSSQLLGSTLAIANETGLTFYDALYVSLAVLEGPPLVTADRKLVRKLEKTRFATHVVWVGDLP